MRYLTLLLLTAAAWGQAADSDARVLQSLLTEVQQLRVAIERSTLLGTRTQIAISKLQMQETRAAQLSRELDNLRDEGPSLSMEKARLSERLKQAEEARTSPQFNSSESRGELESQIRQMKLTIEEFGAKETRRSAREGELAGQAQAAQAEVADSRSRIAEMERALDAAIQQLLKPR
jgi:chromosome segregation ATPase